MCERTRFPKEVLFQLPDLKLLTTTGPRNVPIDLEVVEDSGIAVSGTGYDHIGTLEHMCVITSPTRQTPVPMCVRILTYASLLFRIAGV
jgi:hypothetical protein